MSAETLYLTVKKKDLTEEGYMTSEALNAYNNNLAAKPEISGRTEGMVQVYVGPRMTRASAAREQVVFGLAENRFELSDRDRLAGEEDILVEALKFWVKR